MQDERRADVIDRLVGGFALLALLALMLVFMTSCSWTRIENNNQQAQGITGATPADTASPSAECALASIQPGTAGDVREIAAGGTLGIGVSLFGPQGLPLVGPCLSRYSATWVSLSGPCTFAASFDGVATAPADATIGALCQGQVTVGGINGRLNLVVVGP